MSPNISVETNGDTVTIREDGTPVQKVSCKGQGLGAAEKSLALLAAINAGLCPRTGAGYGLDRFERFWAAYAEASAESRKKELQKLRNAARDTRKMLDQQCEQCTQKPTHERSPNLGLAVYSILGGLLGALLHLALELLMEIL